MVEGDRELGDVDIKLIVFSVLILKRQKQI